MISRRLFLATILLLTAARCSQAFQIKTPSDVPPRCFKEISVEHAETPPAKRAWSSNLTSWTPSEARPGPVPILMFKRPRSGSSWMASLLRNDRNFMWFIDEMQGCDPGASSATHVHAVTEFFTNPQLVLNRKAFNHVCPEKKSWKVGNCGKVATGAMGFTYNADHPKIASMWEPVHHGKEASGWQALLEASLANPIRFVLFVRTNMVKMSLSILNGDIRREKCGSLKTRDPKVKRCVESLPKQTHVDVKTLLQQLFKTRDIYESLRSRMHHLIDKAGQKQHGIYVLTYEELQMNEQQAIGDLLYWCGLNVTVSPPKTSFENPNPSEDLRDKIRNFEEVERALRPFPCFHQQLMSTKLEIFPPCEVAE